MGALVRGRGVDLASSEIKAGAPAARPKEKEGEAKESQAKESQKTESASATVALGASLQTRLRSAHEIRERFHRRGAGGSTTYVSA